MDLKCGVVHLEPSIAVLHHGDRHRLRELPPGLRHVHHLHWRADHPAEERGHDLRGVHRPIWVDAGYLHQLVPELWWRHRLRELPVLRGRINHAERVREQVQRCRHDFRREQTLGERERRWK